MGPTWPPRAHWSSAQGDEAGSRTTWRQFRLPGSEPARRSRKNPRSEQRGLADTRRPDNADERRLGEPCDELGDDAVAPAEELGVADVERGEALEGTDDELAGTGSRWSPRAGS